MREPTYRLHKTSGRAYVYLNGKAVYLGQYGTEESKRAYDRVKAEWLSNRSTKASRKGMLLSDVCLAFLEHAEGYYSDSEYRNLKIAINPVSILYAEIPAADFGVFEFRTIRDWWLNTPIDTSCYGKRKSKTGAAPQKKKKPSEPKPPQFRTRQYVNQCMKKLIRVFTWAAGQAMIPPTIPAALRCVEPLKRGRSKAPEAKPIKPVDAKLVEATLPHLTQVLADMVRFQQLTGCRPGEVCKIKPSMVDRSGDVWIIELTEHKTSHHDKRRFICVGPQAQAVLLPYLLRGADDYCFSPIESEKLRRAAQHAKRVTPLSCGNKPGTNKLSRKPRQEPGMSYTTGSYAKAIKYACARAKLDHWHPNMLRHAAATKIRKEHGLEAAQVILGHSEADVTQVYAERDLQKAIEVARRVG